VHQLVIVYGNSSRAWYPFPLLRLTEKSIKKKFYITSMNAIRLSLQNVKGVAAVDLLAMKV
jgi:hypothetical protein